MARPPLNIATTSRYDKLRVIRRGDNRVMFPSYRFVDSMSKKPQQNQKSAFIAAAEAAEANTDESR